MKLRNQVALITGASRGIGRAIAKRLASEGALIAVHYGKNAAAAKETVKNIEDAGGKAFAVKAELSSITEIAELFKQMDKELSQRTGTNQFDILINNAGIAEPATIQETTEDLFDRTLNINTKALLFVTQHALQRLKDGARIINISTGATRLLLPGFCVYTMSKCAIDGLTVMLAKQLGKQGITVNTIAPGVTDTDMAAHALTPEVKHNLLEDTALGRIGTPEDIANVAAFLVSEEGHWITGQYIEASGGLSL
jgi:3-oxoacyl-[acyl-carrier protein] reductase